MRRMTQILTIFTPRQVLTVTWSNHENHCTLKTREIILLKYNVVPLILYSKQMRRGRHWIKFRFAAAVGVAGPFCSS